MKNFLKKQISGFTILELIVVIAIIAILSSVAMTQFQSAQKKSRDARRMSDIQQLEKALNLYFTDNNVFPIITEETVITDDDALTQALVNGSHMVETPSDPRNPDIDPNSQWVYTYQSNSAGTDYTINFCLETNTIQNYSEGCENSVSP